MAHISAILLITIFFIMSENYGVNVDVNSIVEQNASEEVQEFKKVSFDPANYLQTKLGNESEKTLKIRLLPFSSQGGGSPFFKIHQHSVKDKEGHYHNYICPVKNNMGEKCPFCETAAEARRKMNETDDPMLKKQLNEIAFRNQPREGWVVRCIERGHEAEGVKFWKFNSSKKRTGNYDTMYNLFKQRMDGSPQKNYNIFDLNNGRDLIITIKKTTDGKTATQIVDDGFNTPLSNDAAQGLKWVHDEKTWTDVYSVKSYDFLSIALTGGIPIYDKAQQKFVDKYDAQAEQEKVKKEAFVQNYTENKVNYGEMPSYTNQASNTDYEEASLFGAVSNPQAAPTFPPTQQQQQQVDCKIEDLPF